MSKVQGQWYLYNYFMITFEIIFSYTFIVLLLITLSFSFSLYCFCPKRKRKRCCSKIVVWTKFLEFNHVDYMIYIVHLQWPKTTWFEYFHVNHIQVIQIKWRQLLHYFIMGYETIKLNNVTKATISQNTANCQLIQYIKPYLFKVGHEKIDVETFHSYYIHDKGDFIHNLTS